MNTRASLGKSALTFEKSLVVLGIAFFGSLGAAHEPTEKIQTAEALAGETEFRLPSTEIRSFALSDFRDFNQVIVLAVDSKTCPAFDLVRLQKPLSEALRKAKELKLLFLDVAIDANREALGEKHNQQPYQYVFDAYQQAAKQFGFVSAGDFALLDAKTEKRLAVGNVLGFEEKVVSQIPSRFVQVWKPVAKTDRCRLGLENPKRVSFEVDFLRPFSRACLSCHMSTQVYDYFTSLDEVLGWKAMSLKTIRQLRMPGRFDPYYTKQPDPVNPSVEDLRKIVAWLEAPPELTSDMRKAFLATRDRRKSFLKNPQPKLPVLLTVELEKPVEVAAVGEAAYLNTFIGKPLTEDLDIQGFDLRTNLQSVHHTTIFAFDPTKVDAKDFSESANMSFHLRASTLKKFFGESVLRTIDGSLDGRKVPFTLVNEPVLATFSRRQGRLVYPLDSAVRVNKGMQFAIQLHMEPSGKKESVSLVFDVLGRNTKESYKPLRRWSVEPHSSFQIAAGRPSYVARSFLEIDKSILLKVISVHTHYRGTAARIQLRNPQGVTMTIASIPFMQFKMDRVLTLSGEGISIEPGSQLISEIEYDNSSRHAANPSPDIAVGLGGSTVDNEMHYPRYLFVEQQSRKETP